MRPRRTPFGRLALCSLLLVALSCGGNAGPSIIVYVTAADAVPLEGFDATLEATVTFEVAADPVAALGAGSGTRIALLADRSGEGTYELESTEAGYVVHGDAPLGITYGLTHLLEALGYGFFHPYASRVPNRLTDPDPAIFGVAHAPERATRGLHLHTLHPIEGYFDVWEPSPENLDGARRIIDWLVKSRGNYIQWPALSNIQGQGGPSAAWLAHMNAIVDYAHARGVGVGLGLQVFGESNLQNAFDLVDEAAPDPVTAIPLRLDALAGVDLDGINLSFGEFFGADPASFIATLDLAVGAVRERWPDADVSGVVHVGNFPDLQVEYMGETLMYYYLVRYAADPDFVPWIHTVMYYDLFEDAGGAYGYDVFDEHREYLFERLEAGQPVAYFPETAYWIAFDNPIPQYLPLYVRSRHLDLARIREQASTNGHADLDAHILFSSGWEWGYWQNDWASLRMSYELPDTWEGLFDDMLASYGDQGARIATVVKALVRDQHTAMIEGRLSEWMASRDATFDIGEALGVFSQPRRPSYEAIAAMSPAERTAFRGDVVARLASYRDVLATRNREIRAIGLASDPFVAEIRDGIEATYERAVFSVALLEATLAFADGDTAGAEAHIAEADATRVRVSAVVARRHEALHDPRPDRITARAIETAGLYDYGYLRETDTQCFYWRELTMVTNLVRGERLTVPACVL
jgi:hypothetical protein